MSKIDRTERAFERFAAALAILGGLGLIFATVVTCISILLRTIGRVITSLHGELPEALSWLRPILGEEEMVTYGIGLALFAALPWVMIRKGHIKIDLFQPFFSYRFNRLLDLLGDLALTIIAYLILTRQWGLIFKSPRRSEPSFSESLLSGDFETIGGLMRTAQESQILGLPLWPTYIVAEFCVLAFFVTACFCVIRSARDLMAERQTEVAR